MGSYLSRRKFLPTGAVLCTASVRDWQLWKQIKMKDLPSAWANGTAETDEGQRDDTWRLWYLRYTMPIKINSIHQIAPRQPRPGNTNDDEIAHPCGERSDHQASATNVRTNYTDYRVFLAPRLHSYPFPNSATIQHATHPPRKCTQQDHATPPPAL